MGCFEVLLMSPVHSVLWAGVKEKKINTTVMWPAPTMLNFLKVRYNTCALALLNLVI